MMNDEGPANWTLENQRKAFNKLKQGKYKKQDLKDSNFAIDNVDDKIIKTRLALKLFERE